MKNKERNVDLIERYLEDRLTGEELAEFNHMLTHDTEFNQLFFDMDLLIQGIRRSARSSTAEEKLTRLSQALSVKKHNTDSTAAEGKSFTIFDTRFQYAIAAFVTLLIAASAVVILLFKPFQESIRPASLAAAYFVPYENAGSGIVRGENKPAQLQKALNAYDRAEYTEAIGLFNKIPVTEENRIQIWMYGGNAYLAAGDVDKAEESFEKLIDLNAGFVIQAEWYLSLCYLVKEEVVPARALLTRIRNAGRYKSREAGEILEKINE